ncbi:MAG: 2-oxoglutarate dehydrogenase E1 component [Acidobacteriota bacterium]|nr:MAG: 2-oxoglutarate dehydrogenase E1 component [Acidobacteriota bacterium]
MATRTVEKDVSRERTLDSFRRWGYLEAELDPLGRLIPEVHPELRTAEPGSEEGRSFYCGPIGLEFMHIPDPARRRWLQERMEKPPAEVDSKRTLERLVRCDLLEKFLQTRYLGNKRFSIKGVDSLIPLLLEMFEEASQEDVQRIILAMSHRGRLNVVVNAVGRPPEEIFAGFEDVDPKSTLGGGDVKYHLGATGIYTSPSGSQVPVHLVSNPSHLEAVDPVALGRVKARQIRLGPGREADVLPILMHGDAAFAGQGILAEVLNLCSLEGFSVGGTVHVIVNNLIGFTASPHELHSSRFASDVAKRVPIPIIHVNGEDPDAVVRAAHLAIEYRYTFGSDVVVDLIGYRLYGHSEVDDPTITQPLLYRRLETHPTLWEAYAQKVGADSAELDGLVEAVKVEYDLAIEQAKQMTRRPVMRALPDYWSEYFGGRYRKEYEVDTGLPAEEIGRLAQLLTRYPDGFNIHPKVARLLEQRAEMGAGKRAIDYGMAEALAYASILKAGHPVRLTGQDCKRGTFNHRHSVLIDIETGEEYFPLQNLANQQGSFECYDSMLSEAAVLGFEYGYSRDFPEGLTLWEAQFGDFANGAQVIIDQFITAAEDKWELLSGLVMLLPHGYEGQGPEHSSARVERFLQLAARDNIQVAQPSTAAQYFHLLRRQILRNWRKPLVVFTPKSMLRHPSASSDLTDFTQPRFQTLITDPVVKDARKILICTGKIGHELVRERDARKDFSTAVFFVEQLYPFPESELRKALAQHPNSTELVWVQEEPANMGALSFVQPRLNRIGGGRMFRSVKRSATGTPATGSAKAHQVEQKTLVTLAFAKIL